MVYIQKSEPPTREPAKYEILLYYAQEIDT